MNQSASDTRGQDVVISELSDVPAPPYLAPSILQRIATLKRRSAFARAVFLSATCVLSVIGFLQTVAYAADELYLTGFIEYAHLLFTDTHVVLDSWKEFALALLQSIPALPLAVASALLCIFLWSLARSARNLSIVFARTVF